MRKIFLCGMAFLVLLSFYVSAATINAASCSLTDVKLAIDSANSGDIVKVPAGRCTWDNQLLITKGINLIGAGIGQTVITSDYGGNSNYWLILYQVSNPVADVPFRLSGFEFNGNLRSNILYMSDNSIYSLTKTRIDHNKFYGSPGPSNLFIRYGPVYGVADNNVIISNPPNANVLMESLDLEDRAWNNTTFTPGTADNFYWEDNNITTTQGVSEAGHGARYSFRHNTVTFNGSIGTWQIFEIHGNQPGLLYATMGAEIYENTIVSNSTEQLFDQRGGIALVYNNNITSPRGSGWIKIREEYNDNICPTIGRTDGADPISGQPQHVSGSYYWGNYHNGVYISTWIPDGYYNVAPWSTSGGKTDYGGSIGDVPKANRDFWDYTASFDGSSGMGVGLLSARPTTCTIGVGYWVPDTKTLYKCNSTNTWTAYYTPYTYPHPFRTDCVKYPTLCDSGLSPPSPPPVAIPGDINGDGRVDISDLVIVASNFGKTSGFDSRANVISSTPEIIDIADLSFVARRFTG